MKKCARKKDYDRRIISIVKSHLLIFGTDLLDLNLGPLPFYQELLNFNKTSPRNIVERVLSIVRANETMLKEGLLVRKKEELGEFSKLENYLLSLLDIRNKEQARTNIVPKTLGLSFIRKNLGFPLFGYHRPESIPNIQGLLVCYQSMAGDGIGRIELLIMDKSTQIQYKNLGIILSSNSQSLHCVLAKQAELSYPGTLIPKTAFTAKNTSHYTLSKRVAVLAASKKKFKLKNKIFDPLYYQYSYLFIADNSLRFKLTRFLLDLFLGSLELHTWEAEPLVAKIIQRVL